MFYVTSMHKRTSMGCFFFEALVARGKFKPASWTSLAYHKFIAAQTNDASNLVDALARATSIVDETRIGYCKKKFDCFISRAAQNKR